MVIKLNIITGIIIGMKKSVDVHLVSALDHEELHNMGNAITDFSMVLKTEPGNIFALLGKARCLLYDFYNKRNLQEGLDTVKKLMDEHNQRNFDVYFLRAKLLWRLGKHSDEYPNLAALYGIAQPDGEHPPVRPGIRNKASPGSCYPSVVDPGEEHKRG